MSNDTTISYDDVIKQMPEDSKHVYALVEAFEATVPPGTPPAAIDMLRRVFICGLMAALSEINRQINHIQTREGDPTRLIALLNGLNISVDKFVAEEQAKLEQLGTSGTRIIRIHQAH